MAKTIRINELTEYSSASPNLPAGGFWERWFDTQSAVHPLARSLDEHEIWEQAVGIGVLAIKDLKR